MRSTDKPSMEPIHDRITIDADQCSGRPCIRGMRIRVIDVLDLLAAGQTAEQVIEELPDLELPDICARLRFASGEVELRHRRDIRIDLDKNLRLSLQRALLSQVVSSLRSVSADIDPSRAVIHLRFVFVRQPSASERDAASGAATEVIADYSDREG